MPTCMRHRVIILAHSVDRISVGIGYGARSRVLKPAAGSGEPPEPGTKDTERVGPPCLLKPASDAVRSTDVVLVGPALRP
jgi:hypothetical protein